MRTARLSLWSAAMVVLATAACQKPRPPAGDLVPPEEEEARRHFASGAISLSGRLLAPDGSPVTGARVQLGNAEVRTGEDGRFSLEALPRHNALLSMQAEGFRPEVLPVELRRPLDEAEVALEPQVLSPAEPGVARMLFTGDFALGRRFMDPLEKTPRDQVPKDAPDALIKASNPAPGALEAVSFVRPLFPTADLRVVNLESPVTDHPATPAMDKPYAFFTLPGALAALTSLGVEYVGLGNNHVYDYQAAGLADTRRHLAAAGLASSGAGVNAAEAFVPWRTERAGTRYAFLSACAISGEEYDTSFLATDAKGGAADLRDTARVQAVLTEEGAAGQVPIALFHGGYEYSERPSPNVAERMRLAAASGAALAIGHHPHTAQGFGREQGMLAAYSLGNFVLDQDRMETMLGLLAEVELRGAAVERARARPIYLEDYRPRLVAGALAETLLRRIAELSHEHGVELVPHNGQGVILPEGQTAEVSERDVTFEVKVPERGWTVVDVRTERRPGESVAAAQLEGGRGRLVAGRDLLAFGDFEDHDVDPDDGEAARWDVEDEAAFLCVRAPHSGVAALCQVKSEVGGSVSEASLRNRLRVPQDGEEPPNRWLSVVGWMRGENAGHVRLLARYYASEGEKEFGEQEVLERQSGSWDWTFFSEDLSLPADPPAPTALNAPRALRLFLRHSAPKRSGGMLTTDDLAVVAWEAGSAGERLSLATPHAHDFVRVEARPGTYTLRVTLREHRLPVP